MALHALRRAVGDRDFFRVLRAWADGHRGGHGTTAQFVRLAERTSGKQLDGLFRTWLYAPGKPDRA
jgi:aminopeptidase N